MHVHLVFPVVQDWHWNCISAVWTARFSLTQSLLLSQVISLVSVTSVKVALLCHRSLRGSRPSSWTSWSFIHMVKWESAFYVCVVSFSQPQSHLQYRCVDCSRCYFSMCHSSEQTFGNVQLDLRAKQKFRDLKPTQILWSSSSTPLLVTAVLLFLCTQVLNEREVRNSLLLYRDSISSEVAAFWFFDVLNLWSEHGGLEWKSVFIQMKSQLSVSCWMEAHSPAEPPIITKTCLLSCLCSKLIYNETYLNMKVVHVLLFLF